MSWDHWPEHKLYFIVFYGLENFESLKRASTFLHFDVDTMRVLFNFFQVIKRSKRFICNDNQGSCLLYILPFLLLQLNLLKSFRCSHWLENRERLLNEEQLLSVFSILLDEFFEWFLKVNVILWTPACICVNDPFVSDILLMKLLQQGN